MTDQVKDEKHLIESIKTKIERLLDDNEQYDITGEYNYYVKPVKSTCETAFFTGRIKRKEYDDFSQILFEIDRFRSADLKGKKRENRKKYLKDLLFWN